MAMHGFFHWNELMTRDAEGAKAFYATVLDWTFDEFPMPKGGTYWVCMADGKPAGGIFDMTGPEFEGVPPHWFSYVEVDDVDTRAEAVKQNGGQLMRDLFDVPGVGRIAIVQDSTGAHVGLITPEAKADA